MGSEGFAIAGPYEFGDQPPAHLMGWAAPELGGMKAVESEFERLAEHFSSFQSVFGSEAPTTLKRMKVWEYGKLVNNGKHLPTGYQETGDCFAAGTMVFGEKTKRIEDVQVGDRVYAGNGTLTRVISRRSIQTMKPMAKVTPLGGLPITCTADHRFLVYRMKRLSGKRVTQSLYERARKRSYAAVVTCYEERSAEWVAAGDLRDTDYLLTPICRCETKPLDSPNGIFQSPEGRFVAGYFLGNGYAGGGTLEWSLPLDGPSEEIVHYLTMLGFRPRVERYKHRNAKRIRVHSVELEQCFREEFYSDTEKVFPAWAIGDQDFLHGLCLADGHGDNHVHHLDSTSPSVVFGAMASLVLLGQTPSVREANRSAGTYPNAKPLYRVSWYGHRQREIVWRDETYVCRPVRRVDFVEGPATVYDIGVEDEQHSFIANGVIVHNCVSWGMRQAGQLRSAWEIAGNYEEERFRYWYAPWIYGTSRVDIGGNQLRGAGSMGSWAAAAVLKYGILFDDDEGVPEYSGRVADSWGYGPPKKFYDIARDNVVKSAVRLESVEQVRAALLQEEPCLVTIASNQGWAMQPVNYKGYHCFVASGTFGHQTCLLDWMDDPFPSAYRFNSWGANAHGTPLNGEPPGGAWWRAEDLEREIRRYDVELYAISLFQGEKGPADHHIVR